MAVNALVSILVAMMLLTGVCNTLLTKYQDQQCVRDCDTPKPKTFEQPVIQTMQMFIGEMGCWLVVFGAHAYTYLKSKYSKRSDAYQQVNSAEEPPSADEDQNDEDVEDMTASITSVFKSNHDPSEGRERLHGWKTLFLAIPSTCDIAGTTLMNIGLLFVAASIYQMTRGMLILFVGAFSVLFLKRPLSGYKWSTLILVVLGVALVGVAGAISKDEKSANAEGVARELAMTVKRSFIEAREHYEATGETPLAVRTIIGIFLIALAQVFTATQFVTEEKIMEKYDIEPIKMVGWEGIFGFLVTVIGMVILHFTVGVTEAGKNRYFDAREGLYEITHNRAIAVSSVLIMISIGGFNFFGLSITRSISSTSRSLIDTCRTLFIWMVSLGLGWETFKWLQVVGFALLVYGTLLYNDVVQAPLRRCRERREILLPEGPIEHN